MQGNKRFGMPYGMPDTTKRRRQIRNWIILLVVMVLAVTGVRLVTGLGGSSQLEARLMPCTADQDVTPFGSNLLYYDGASIQCLNREGGIRWTFPVGGSARFSVSDTQIVIWSGTQLFIVDQNGNPSYSENMASEVQFARIGDTYCAVVIGEDTAPELIVKNLDGTQLDQEIDAFANLMLLDVGFYGANDQYMWSLALDVYGAAINTVLNTFQVGKMNTGETDLGEYLAYKVLFENNKLRVFTTQQMYTYDYKAVQDTSATRLVYGWQFLDASVPERGSANMLLAPTAQITSSLTITELRVLSDNSDRRYTLPSACVGACIDGSNLYAVSSDYLYHANVDKQRFYGSILPLPEGEKATRFIGLLDGGYGVISAGEKVYVMSLPR